MAEYKGRIDSVIFRNEDNGYSVLTVVPEDGREFTAVGIIPFADEGDYVRMQGDWCDHASYGKQLKVTSFEFCRPEGKSAIEKYLCSGLIRGIGPDTAKRIVKHFGVDTLKVLDETPARLTEVDGIGPKKAVMITESYNEKREAQNTVVYFIKLGLSPSVALRIFTAYGADSILIARSDPYRLADEIHGIGFKTADTIALRQGYTLNDERRICAGLNFVLEESLNNDGHTYLPMQEFVRASAEILQVNEEEIETNCTRLVLSGKLVNEDADGESRVYLKRVYTCECDVAVRLYTIASYHAVSARKETEVPSELSDGTVLSENQRQALSTALNSTVTVITGGPGTGKTTLIRGIIDILGKRESIQLCAPTGRAAKRMSEATGKNAQTVHRLLEYGQDEEESFKKNEEEPLSADTVIVDEMSMVDIFLMRALLRALKPGSRLILTGDADQLPSVGAGNVLKDIIASGAVPVVRLTEVFRQSRMSAIVTNAHLINRGEMPVVNAKGTDFFLERVADAKAAAQGTVELVMRRLPNYMKLDPIRDIQVMAPMKKGDAGVFALNAELQEKLNPLNGRKQLRRGECCFRGGDKVMQIKNDYSICWKRYGESGTGVFNGDIGYVQDVDTEDDCLTIRFEDDRLATYDRGMLDEIELAYCMSVHKSQGSEFPCVVLPLVQGPPMLMSRNLLYTAVTRARKLVVIIGRSDCVRAMVLNDHMQARYTALAERLRVLSGVGNAE